MNKLLKIIKDPFHLYRGLPRSVYILFFSGTIVSLGGFVVPFLTIFLTDKFELKANDVGLYMMIITLSLIPGILLGGKLGDIVGRKKVILVGQTISAACFIICAFQTSPVILVVLICISNLFLGTTVPCTRAMAIDLSTQENRGNILSLMYLGHNIGFAIGPLLAGLLYKNHMHWLFLGDALTTIIAVGLFFFYVKESLPSENEINQKKELSPHEQVEESGVVVALMKRPSLLLFMVIMMILNTIYYQMNFTLPIFLIEVFEELGPIYFGFLMSVNAIVIIVATVFIMSLTNKNLPIINIMLASLLFTFGFGMLYFVHDFWLFVVSTIIWTIGEIILVVNVNLFLANRTPINHRARFNAVFPIISHIGIVFSPPLLGLFIDEFSARDVWVLCFILAGVSMFTLYLFHMKTREINSAEIIEPNTIGNN
jgi:MFS family permease